MKILIKLLLVTVLISCGKDEDILSDNSIGENVSILVHPRQTDADERKLTINFSFLEKGKYKAKIFEDAKNANEYPSEVNYKEEVFTNIDSFSIELAKGG